MVDETDAVDKKQEEVLITIALSKQNVRSYS